MRKFWKKPAKKKKPNLRAEKNKEERKYCDSNDLIKDATEQALKYQQGNDKSTRIDAERMKKKQLAEKLKEERREARLEKKAKEAELLKAKGNANMSEKKKIKKFRSIFNWFRLYGFFTKLSAIYTEKKKLLMLSEKLLNWG